MATAKGFSLFLCLSFSVSLSLFLALYLYIYLNLSLSPTLYFSPSFWLFPDCVYFIRAFVNHEEIEEATKRVIGVVFGPDSPYAIGV